jgi:adenylate kinase family enzyme
VERVVVMGSPGSGKSTFARALGARLGLPVVHLDAFYYGPEWAAGETEMFRAHLLREMASGHWITDGNFVSQTADLRFPIADAVIILDQPLWLRIVRAIRRALRRDTSRPDRPAGCQDSFDATLLKDILNFERIDKPKIDAALKRHAPGAKVFRLKGDTDMRAYLQSAGTLSA